MCCVVEDIYCLNQIKNVKQVCSFLLQRGSVGDDFWQSFQRVEIEMIEEFCDVVIEVCDLVSWICFLGLRLIILFQVNVYVLNWGQIIFVVVYNMIVNIKFCESFDEI